MKEFNKYARLEHGISSMTMHRYESVLDGYINPTIIEERKLNVASMDVFSRLMMDRIIFLGVPIDDDVANIIQAQLLFLASNDSSSDISLYLNTPGGQVSSGLGIYDTMQSLMILGNKEEMEMKFSALQAKSSSKWIQSCLTVN